MHLYSSLDHCNFKIGQVIYLLFEILNIIYFNFKLNYIFLYKRNVISKKNTLFIYGEFIFHVYFINFKFIKNVICKHEHYTS